MDEISALPNSQGDERGKEDVVSMEYSDVFAKSPSTQSRQHQVTISKLPGEARISDDATTVQPADTLRCYLEQIGMKLVHESCSTVTRVMVRKI